MGWGTTFTSEIYLSRKYFDTVYDIEEYIKEKEEDIKAVERQLLMYASSTPKDIIPDGWKDDRVNFLSIELKNILGALEEFIVEKYNAELLLNYVVKNKTDLSKLKT